MKQKTKCILKICCALVFALMFALSGIIIFENKNYKMVYADDTSQYDSETQIFDNDEIISSSLWGALKRFYNINKTPNMPEINKTEDEENEEYLTINQFRNFPYSKLNLSYEEIDSIENLGIFDLSSFTEIDLSKNQIQDIGTEFVKLENLKKLNLSNNNLYNFSYTQLNQNCYNNLEELNISHNLINVCDLKLLKNAQIDASHNSLTKEKLTLPDQIELKVKLSYNFIFNPSLTNQNIDYGLQGVKNNGKYVRGQKIEYYGIEDIANIKIYYTQTTEDNISQETLVKTLAVNDEAYTFGLGHYRIEFDTETKTAESADILIYIIPKKPTVKMFRDGKELTEIEYVFNAPTIIKFYGEENAKFAYRLNSGELIYADEIEIKELGINVLNLYQIVDGYSSDAETIFLEYKQKTLKGWIFVIAGSIIFAGAFYLIIKYYPLLVKKHIGKKTEGKKNLD